jgi:hypothetical protein
MVNFGASVLPRSISSSSRGNLMKIGPSLLCSETKSVWPLNLPWCRHSSRGQRQPQVREKSMGVNHTVCLVEIMLVLNTNPSLARSGDDINAVDFAGL